MTWDDFFLDQPFSLKYPALLTYASNKSISLQKAIACNDLLQLFRLPMSRPAYNEFMVFKDSIAAFRGLNMQNYNWIYIWNNSTYSSSKFYRHHCVAITPPAPFH
jgi:hypothetical protein